MLAVALGRFILRALPLRFSDRSGRGRFGTILSVVVCVVFVSFSVWFTVAISVATNSKALTPVLSDADKTIYGFCILLVVLYLSGAICPVILRHWKPRAFLERPFTLFLRRFSTFSDRAVISLVLRAAASRVPVVFLTPTFSRPGDWDPFLVGFAGFKLLHPWKSMPIVLRASDDDWQGVAGELIRRSKTILLDTSETSSAMRTEAEMINNAGRWSDTVCLRLLARNAGPGTDPFGGSAHGRIIDYRKSWVRPLPRMAIGLVALLIAGIHFLGSLLIFTPSFVAILIFSVVVYVYYSAFVRPTINREAKSALKAILGEPLDRREHLSVRVGREVLNLSDNVPFCPR